MNIKANLPIMVLVNDCSDKLSFRFNSILWGYLCLLIGIVLGIATLFAFAEEGNNWMVASLFGMFSLIFLYSSIYCFKLRRILEIDGAEQIIRYVESGLYKKIEWQKRFQDFEGIKTFRTITTAGSGGAKKAKNWAIQLISKEGEIFAIGYNQFGALNKRKAEKLATRVADIMKIKKDIIDE